MNFSYDLISSRTNPLVLYFNKLKDKKYRDAEKKFRIDGIKLFKEAVDSKVVIESVALKESEFPDLSAKLEKEFSKISKSNIKILADGVFEKISEEKSPEGIICIAKHIDKLHKIATINNIADFSADYLSDFCGRKVFLLESVRDPGNLGTIIRSCDAFSVDCLILSNDCADLYNSKTVRGAMGALFRQKILRVDNISLTIKALREFGRKVYAATLGKNADLLGKAKLSDNDCIVVGNEGHGLTDNCISSCDGNIMIPMNPDSESLNAAVAASILIWEQFG